MQQEALRTKLRTYIEEVKARNPSYSMRSLAKHIDVPAGNLSQFLAGKRNFSRDKFISIVELITVNPEERKELMSALMEETPEVPAKPRPEESDRLSEEEFLQLEEWYYFSVRTALSLSNAKSTSDWIAAKLGITIQEAEKALKVLFRLKLIQLNDKGEIVRTKKHLITPDSTKKSPKIGAHKNKIHGQHISRALKCLDVDPSLRDITWVNIPTNPEKLDRARELIRKFQDDMLDLLEDENTSELYRLTIQLCPMT